MSVSDVSSQDGVLLLESSDRWGAWRVREAVGARAGTHGLGPGRRGGSGTRGEAGRVGVGLGAPEVLALPSNVGNKPGG